MSIRIKANKSPWTGKVDILVADISLRGKMAVAKDVVFHTLSDNEIYSPTFSIDGDSAQELIDELWRCGLRPTEGVGSVGQLSATERHLKDMQRLVFDHLISK